VYDAYGAEGVDSMDQWQVGPLLKSQSEMRAEFEMHQLKKKQMEAELLTRSIAVTN
jgi:hypothetical protein